MSKVGRLVLSGLLLASGVNTASAQEPAPSQDNIIAPKPVKSFKAQQKPFVEAPIFRAIRENNLSKLKQCIETELEYKDIDGYTPLLCAIEFKREDMVDALIEAGANLNVRVQESGHTVMHIAAALGTPRIIASLAAHGVDANIKNDFAMPPICVAASRSNVAAIEALVKHGADVNFKLEPGGSPLHCAFDDGSLKSAQKLIELGADIEAQDSNKITPFLVACKSGNCKAIRYLMSLGVDVEHKNVNGCGAIFFAVGSDNPEAIKLLIDKGLVIEDEGALMATAAQCNCKKSMEYLIDQGVSVDVKDRGLTPLHHASHYCNIEIARFLIDHKADPNVRDNNGNTPLHFAFDGAKAEGGVFLNTKRIEEMAMLLIQAGSDPTAKNAQGWTPGDIITFMYHNNGLHFTSFDQLISKAKALRN